MPKAQSRKEIIDTMSFIQIKNVCFCENEKRNQVEKIFAKGTADKGLLSEKKNSYNSKKKEVAQLKKGPKTSTDTTPKKIQVANKMLYIMYHQGNIN